MTKRNILELNVRKIGEYFVSFPGLHNWFRVDVPDDAISVYATDSDFASFQK